MALKDIKAQIKTDLDALVTSGDLAGATTSDLKKYVLDYDIPSFPHAFIMPPAIEAANRLTNREVTRAYIFTIMVIMKAEDIADADDVETLMQTILDKFDNDITLGGNACGGIEPVVTQPEPFDYKHQSYVTFDIIIRANDVVALSFS